MKKTHSVFSKYFLVCTAAILFSILCLVGVVLLVSFNIIYDNVETDMINTVDKIIPQTQTVMAEDKDNINDRLLKVFYENTRDKSYDIYLLNSDGIVSVSTKNPQLNNSNMSRLFRDNIMDEMDFDGYYAFSDFNDGLNSKFHIGVNEFSYNGKAYYLLASTSNTAHVSQSQLMIFIVCIFATIIICCVIVYFATKGITSPIKEMAELAKKIEKGDYSKRLPIGNTTELAELATALNEMTDSIELNDKVKNEFVSNVSHELRTPLTSISGFIDGILDGTIPSANQENYIKIISTEVKRLTRLTRLMLNLTKLDSGVLKPALMDVQVINMIVDILNTFEGRIDQKNIEILGLDVGTVIIYADQDMAYQVIYNLIENAIKFTPQNGYIEFGFNSDNEEDYISIKNSGDGLTDQQCKQVFNRFYKTDESRAKDAMGVGLGLNIVKSIIGIHHGTIDVDSVLGEYTQFTFSIPKRKK